MNWEATLAEAEYLRAAEARDNAKMIDKLSSGRVTEIAVVQDASLGLKKVKPQRAILAILAAALAVAIGVFQAVARSLLFDSPNSANTDHRKKIPAPEARIDRAHHHSPETQQTRDTADAATERLRSTSSIEDEFADSASVPGVPR
ncbi:hypothetical protein [Rhodopirellula sallentina]|uniref:Uncharacterized protein n=1 Tax=Rhodopirellula sallentina SM41 TaxID=1263870 RepID=M5UDY8_9BACT|nr:hypothetical protein [Rhodopirellula sallentina]EMI56076.1 hypothetical protein RSSM_02489 [Rhodopirellula sallentina SM41]